MSKKINKKKLTKDIISCVLAFFVAMGLSIFFICIMLEGGLFNKETFKTGFSDSSYYEECIESLNNNLNNRITNAGLPESTGNDVFKSGAVTTDINTAVEQILNGKQIDINYSIPGDTLRENILAYLNAQGLGEDDSVNRSIDLLVRETVNDYQAHISFSFVKEANKFFDKYISLVKIVKYISLAVLIISVLLLFFVRSRVYRGVRYVEYGILAGSILTYLFTTFMKHDIVKYIPEQEGAYRELISSYVLGSFSQGQFMFLAGLLLLVVFRLFNIYLKKQVI